MTSSGPRTLAMPFRRIAEGSSQKRSALAVLAMWMRVTFLEEGEA